MKGTMLKKTSVVWFRRDLRLEDNLALTHALENSDQVMMVFNIDSQQIRDKPTVSQSAFFASVNHFKNELQNKQIKIHIFREDLNSVFQKIKTHLPDWHDLYFNFDERGYGRKRDQDVVSYCEQLGVDAHPFMDFNLHGSKEIKKQDGSGYQVFTPYYKRWIQMPKQNPINKVTYDDLMEKAIFNSELGNEKIDDLIDNKHEFAFKSRVGSQHAQIRLRQFIQNDLEHYDTDRDFPHKNNTSHLSRYLRTGEISIRTVFEAVRQAPDSNGQHTFIQELCWRDYYNMIYTMNPKQRNQPIRSEFTRVAWLNNQDDFKKWQLGETGFPIIDAAMRQLNLTGWMHNRLRMIVASFLTKDLLIDWRWGEKYFQEKLIDYDPASNIGGWQWAASTGTDSVPYFRIFNPTIQSKKFDNDGNFIKKYVPELKKVDVQNIHEPNKLKQSDQEKLGIIIGDTYPKPIVNHASARIRAIEAYKKSKSIKKSDVLS